MASRSKPFGFFGAAGGLVVAAVGLLLTWSGDGSRVASRSQVYLPGLREEELTEQLTAMGAGSPEEPLPRRAPAWQVRPDRVTEFEGQVGYEVVFSPSIAPFKRVAAFETVQLDSDGQTPVLTLASGGAASQPVSLLASDAQDAAHDQFDAQAEIDLSGGPAPLPSVSPDSRIHGLHTVPAAQVAVHKDAADNFVLVPLEPAARRLLRVTWKMDAPQDYFAGSVPSVRSDLFSSEVPPMPDEARAQAMALASELGIRRGDPLDDVLVRLVGHFRSFEESAEPPANSGQILVDLTRSRKGVCRHRAYAFVLVAQALGVRARFVQNEAHSWVEVKLLPDRWRRIDLGGAPEALAVHGALDSTPAHRPQEAVEDPLPQPPEYLASQARAVRPGAATSQRVSPRRSWWTHGKRSRVGEARTALVIHLNRSRYEALRGRKIQVIGRAVVAGDGAPAPGVRIEVRLRELQDPLLGLTITDAEGHFETMVAVPSTTPVGDYTLDVSTPGDARYGPSVAR